MLFCDLVGFTARSDQADPEDVGALLRPYHPGCGPRSNASAAPWTSSSATRAMAVFGAPVAHEDDPERAVRCALGVLAAIDELNQAYPSLDLAIRIGITTGEALVRLGPDQQSEGVVGDVVNTASRLEGVAPARWGGGGGGDLPGDPAPVRLPGTGRGAGQGQGRPGAGVAPGAGPQPHRHRGRPPGRHPLHRPPGRAGAAQEPVRPDGGRPDGAAGHGRRGAGGGQVPLRVELAASVDARPGLVTWRQGRCLPYGDGITFWALGEIVKAQAGILEVRPLGRGGGQAGGGRGRHAPGRVGARLAAGAAGPLLGIAGPDAVKAERAELFAAWRRFVEAMAASHPLVLVVEDLHWADPAMLEFLEHLVERSADLPLLIVATARPELLERQPRWGQGNAASTRIPLGALTDLETARLVAVLVGRSMLPVGVQALLLERAAGNPLYAEEFAPPPHRPGPGRRGRGRGRARHPRPRHRPRADRGPPGRPHPRGRGAGPGRRRGRPGLLARRGRRHGRQPVRPRG